MLELNENVQESGGAWNQHVTLVRVVVEEAFVISGRISREVQVLYEDFAEYCKWSTEL